MASSNGVAIKILGKEYQVACPEDQTHSLLDAAFLLDSKMKEIRASGKIIGADRIAVMAALNLAHEFLLMKTEAEDTEHRLQGICAKLDDSFV